jgi:putative ABC transport system permease protein
MLTSHLKVALRNLLRQKFYAIINIFGLAVGLAICLLILLFVRDELSYDNYHSKAGRIYRIVTEWKNPRGEGMYTPMNEYRLATALETDFPEFEGVIRFGPARGSGLVEYEDQQYQETRIFLVDAGVFDVFDFELLKGNPATALKEPFSILLSESTATKYFGDEEPVGEILRFDGQLDGTVTGVYRDFPRNSHFTADFLISMETGKQVYNQLVLNNWGELSQYIYVLLPQQVNPADVEARFPAFLEKNVQEGASNSRALFLQPLRDIHLRSNYYAEIEANGNIRNIYIASAIALFIILIACINYMNLATARSVRRAMEIGVRKTMGAMRGALMGQFLIESVLLALIAFLFSLALARLALPGVNAFTEKSLTMSPLDHPGTYLAFLGLVLGVGVLAGSYPAFYLSSFRIARVFQEKSLKNSSSGALRKVLVVFQFAISVVLIIGTIIIFNQWSFLRDKELGYNRDNLVLVPIPGTSNYQSLKQQLEQHPNIISVGASNKQLTGALSSNLGFQAEGYEPASTEIQSIKVVTVDHDFLKTLQVNFAGGRDFSRAFGADAAEGFVLNQAAVRMIGWDEPVGKWFQTNEFYQGAWRERRGKVIGVIEDLNMESLYEEIAPVVYFVSDTWLNWMTIRIGGNDVPGAIDYLREKWTQFGSIQLFDYTFLDDRIAEMYRNEERFFRMFIVFTFLAIFIAGLGILGLSSFTAEQRAKEIGVRKVFGATVGNIVALLLREFTFLVLAGFVAAAPVAWFLMNRWLNDFNYRIDIGPQPFLLAGAMAVAVAWFTAGVQSARAAMANPVKALRYE